MSVYKTGLKIAILAAALTSASAFAVSNGELEGKAGVNTEYPAKLNAQAKGAVGGESSSTTRAQVSQEGQSFKQNPVNEDGWRQTNGERGAVPDKQSLARSSDKMRNQTAVKSKATNSRYPNDKPGAKPSEMNGSPDSMSGNMGAGANTSTTTTPDSSNMSGGASGDAQ